MRFIIRYLLILVASIGGFLLTWLFTQPELVGHWHVVESLGTDNSGMQGIHHFNIYASGEVRVNESIEGEYVLPGFVEKLRGQIHFGGECWYVGTEYRIRGRRMELRSRESREDWHALALRTKPEDCDAERDYFAGLPLEIRLPERPTEELTPLTDFHHAYTFYLGEDKATGEDCLMAYRYRDIGVMSDLNELVERQKQR